MRLTTTTPDTLLLGVYAQHGQAVVLGSLCTRTATLRTETLYNVGQTWNALAAALGEVDAIGPAHVLLLTNAEDLLRALRRPFAPPTPAQTKHQWVAKGEYVTVGWGGDAAHWQVLQWLGMHGGQWEIRQVDDLPKARAQWQLQFGQ